MLFIQTPLVLDVHAQGKIVSSIAAADDFSELRAQGFEHLSKGNWTKAVLVFDQILSGNSLDTTSLYGSGLALFNLRRIPEAELRIVRVVELLSEKSEAKKLLADSLVLSAVILAAQNKNELAIARLQKAFEIAPDSFDVNMALGRAYFGNSDIVNSVKYFRKATAINPKSLQARFFLASALEKGGELPDALREYRELVKLDENYAEGNLGLGVLLINSEGEKSAEGLQALRKAILINGNLYEARITLGKALIKLDQAEESVIHLEKAAELLPGNPEPHYQLALAYRKLGKKAKADAQMLIVKEIHQKRRNTNVKP